jgi:putative acetyltransferase
MKLRRAITTSEQDALGILQVHRNAVHGTASLQYSAEILAEWAPIPITPEMISQFIADKGKQVIIYVAEDEVSGKIVGFSEIDPLREELHAVYVDPEFGRIGLGKSLLAQVESDAKQSGCTRLTLHASLNAKNFYEQNGYKVLRSDQHTLRSGRKMDCFVMQKIL